MSSEAWIRRTSYSLYGLQQATQRFEAAHWHRPEDAFIAAAEAVSWATALDSVLAERNPASYKQDRGNDARGQSIIGMRFVRDHVHHAVELLDFVTLSAVVGGAMGLRAQWMWAPLEQLEDHLDPSYTSGKGLYRDRLQDQPVAHTLVDANHWFVNLSPPIPPLLDPREEF